LLADGKLQGHGRRGQADYFLLLPIQPPPAYRLRLRVRRLRDGGPLWVGVASGKGRGVLAFGSTYTDLGIINEEEFQIREEDKAKHHRQNLLPGVPVRLVCTVRPGSVQVTRDGEALYEWRGSIEQQLSRWDVHPYEPLYLGGYGLGGFEFDEVFLEPL
jgi:hypothetical protein